MQKIIPNGSTRPASIQPLETKSGRPETIRDRLRELIGIRFKYIVPLIGAPKSVIVYSGSEGVIAIDWNFGDKVLEVRMNLSSELQPVPPHRGDRIWQYGEKRKGGLLPSCPHGRR
ncbi:hypothetical protein BKP54_30715 [Ensifer sp. 1H6]|nr:hypothetical protein BKP54_30715 [Ensifer sp. 1H6]